MHCYFRRLRVCPFSDSLPTCIEPETEQPGPTSCCSNEFILSIGLVASIRYRGKQDTVLHAALILSQYGLRSNLRAGIMFQNFLGEHAPRSPHFVCLCIHRPYIYIRHICKPPFENPGYVGLIQNPMVTRRFLFLAV